MPDVRTRSWSMNARDGCPRSKLIYCSEGDQRQLVLPVGDDYFCRSHVVIIRYRRCRIGYGSASRITEAKTDGRKETTNGGGHGWDERAIGAQVAERPVAVGDQLGSLVAHPAQPLRRALGGGDPAPVTRRSSGQAESNDNYRMVGGASSRPGSAPRNCVPCNDDYRTGER